MSINIPSDILNISDSLDVTVDVSKLGKNQRIRLIRELRTGVIRSNGVASRIAKQIREDSGSDYIRYYGKRWDRLFYKLGDVEAIRRMEGAVVASKLMDGQTKDTSDWAEQYRKKNRDVIAKELAKGKNDITVLGIKAKFSSWYTGIQCGLLDNALKGYKVSCDTCSEIADRIEKGELTKLTITLHRNELELEESNNA